MVMLCQWGSETQNFGLDERLMLETSAFEFLCGQLALSGQLMNPNVLKLI